MLPNGDTNSRNIDNESTVKSHTHTTFEIVNFQSALDAAISNVRGRVPEDGDTLGKLYDYIISGSLQIVVPDISARDSLDIYSLSTQVFVVDTGNGWGLFKPVQLGTNVDYVKLSDSEMLNKHLGVEALTDAMLPQSNTATSEQLVMGDDARLSDSRPPLPHTHAVHNITGIEAVIDTSISTAVSKLPVGVTTVNTKTGDINLTKSDVGLDNVDNTRDIDKPVSISVSQALDRKINITALPSKAAAGDNEIVLGIDPRLRDAREPLIHKHSINDVTGVNDYIKKIVEDTLSVYDNGVHLVNGKSGVVTLTKADLDLSRVDNTADTDKPLSDLQKEALSTKIGVDLLPNETTGLLVRDSDPRLTDARLPLPHMTESIVDFIDSSITVAKVAVKSMVSSDDFTVTNDTLELSNIQDLVPGKYTRVYVNERGRVLSGSAPSTISELGIYDVYDKTQIDNLLANIPNVLESNTANRLVKLNDYSKIPDNLINSSLHFFPRFSRFPSDGNNEHLYIDKETNTIYRFENEYVKLTPDVVVTEPVDTLNRHEFATVAFSGSYFDLKSLPAFSNVAKSGDFKDLKNTPVYAPIATSGSFNDLVDRPTFADIAWSGSYLDLHNLPDFAPVATTGSYTSLSDLPEIESFVTKTDESLYKTKTLNIIGNLAPRAGKARWYPEKNVTILYAYASVNDAAYSDIVSQISHNFRPVNDASITINVGEYRSEPTQLNFSMKSSDFLTIDIVQAVGKDLSVTIVYR